MSVKSRIEIAPKALFDNQKLKLTSTKTNEYECL